MPRAVDEDSMIGSVKLRGASAPETPVERADTPMPPDARGVQPDRRRPGRQVDVSPGLIPLVRDLARSKADPQIFLPERSASPDLDTAMGILIGILLSIPIWVLLVLVAWWIL